MEGSSKLNMIAAMLMVTTVINVLLLANAGSGGWAICGVTKEGMASCMPSVCGDNPLPPTPACCSALSSANMPCLCAFKTSKLLPRLGIDPNAAMELPAKCDPNFAISSHC